MKQWLVYDCEIIKGILGKDEQPIEGINYCAGWRDFANMGISVIGAYDYANHRYRVFCRDNWAEFAALAADRNVVSFNGIAFDDRLCAANGIEVATHYDILVEVWRAAGLGPEFQYPSHAGYGLDAIVAANGIGRKSGHGAKAPIQWQRGEIGAVIDYCLQDVRLTKILLDNVLFASNLRSPKDGGGILKMRSPMEGAK